LIFAVRFLCAPGRLISIDGLVLLHRTNDAKSRRREADVLLERDHPPWDGRWGVPISPRTMQELQKERFCTFAAHKERSSPREPVSWMDRGDLDPLREIRPRTFRAVWKRAIVAAGVEIVLFR
jgi:hypothetical protein